MFDTDGYAAQMITREFLEDEPLRVDKYLSQESSLSRSRIKALIEEGHLSINDESVNNPRSKLKWGDTLSLSIPEAKPWYPEAQNIPLDIVFEDEHLIVINKQVGLTVHPGAGQPDNTLVNALLYHCGDSLSGIGGIVRPGIVHRLDKDTSGLMVIAKHDEAHHFLSDQFVSRTLSRKYKALVLGVPMPPKNTVDLPMGRHKTNRLKMAVQVKNSKTAATHYTVLERYPTSGESIGEYSMKHAACLVECKLETGRTHQIRVHMDAIGHPLLGDPLYSIQKTALDAMLRKYHYHEEATDFISSFKRQALHAYSLSFVHPETKETVSFTADYPDDMKTLIDYMKDGTEE